MALGVSRFIGGVGGNFATAAVNLTPLPTTVNLTTPSPTTTPTPAAAPAPVGKPGPNGQPAPAGYTWVPADPQTGVPGHWGKIGAVASPNQVVEVNTHDTDATSKGEALIEEKAKSYLFTADQSIDTNFIVQLFTKNGATPSEASEYYNNGTPDNYPNAPQAVQTTYSGTNQALNGKRVYLLKDGDALAAHNEGMEPADWYAKQWIHEIRAKVAAVTATGNPSPQTPGGIGGGQTALPNPPPPPTTPAAPKPPSPLPPLPLPTRPPTASSGMNIALIAVAVGLAFYFMGKL